MGIRKERKDRKATRKIYKMDARTRLQYTDISNTRRDEDGQDKDRSWSHTEYFS